ncbi:unnamed protein product [Hymenolepis diminuta]|uniref:PBPe domain-containing protein n=1 Tax=Hymenolepis diminuta TaxID=6216 RepID=A0A0R3SMX7_HYMDI|nr:unnamed protein product [Hymenolepis diminuta]
MVIFILQQSEDHVLKKLLSTAQSNWPNETYSNSVTEAAKRINGNEFDVLIASRLEAEQILSGECKLERIGVAEYLFPLAFLLSGPDDFVKSMKKRINALANNQFLNTVAVRTLGLGNCPLTLEAINVRTSPLSIKEMGGLFCIVLVGIVVSFIVAGIEYIVEKYPVYQQWHENRDMKFGEGYTGEVLDVQ